MNRLRTMRDAHLHDTIGRLKRDVEDFTARAAREASALEREGRPIGSNPLHQRLTSIRNHLSEQLRQAEEEVARRANLAATRRAWSLRTALAGLMGARARAVHQGTE
jgi:hypothetical protein